MNDIQVIFDKVKNKHSLLLTETGKLADEGFTINVPVICGTSALGRFWLYREGDEKDDLLVFSYTFAEAHGGESDHGHPYDIDNAVECIEQFMKCNISFFK